MLEVQKGLTIETFKCEIEFMEFLKQATSNHLASIDEKLNCWKNSFTFRIRVTLTTQKYIW